MQTTRAAGASHLLLQALDVPEKAGDPVGQVAGAQPRKLLRLQLVLRGLAVGGCGCVGCCGG